MTIVGGKKIDEMISDQAVGAIAKDMVSFFYPVTNIVVSYFFLKSFRPLFYSI